MSRIRGKLLRTLLLAGFTGDVHPVNPSHARVQGLTAYPDLHAIGQQVDLVMVGVPAASVMAVLEDAAAIGAGAAIVHSAAEPDPQVPGGTLVADIAAFVARTGMRVLGPNAEGIWNVLDRVGANFAPVLDPAVMVQEPVDDRTDRISIVSQSGALGFALYAQGVQNGLAFRHVVTTGNEADIETLEVVDHLVAAGDSAAIVLFLEGLDRPDRFASVAASAADAGVPLIVMKVGSSEAGARAAVSHTAHLAGSDTAYDALFERYGVLRVADPEELMAVAGVLSARREPAGTNVAIITTTGGAGGWASDLCGEAGLAVPPLGDDLRAELAGVVPSYGSTANPVDVTAAAIEGAGENLVTILEAVDRDPDLHAAIVMLNMISPDRVARLEPFLRPLLERIRIPVVFHSPSPPAPENVRALGAMGAPYAGIRGAAKGIAAAVRYRRFRDRWVRPVPAPPGAGGDLAALLARHGVPTPPEAVVHDADGAVAVAQEHGYPVALKVVSPDLPHKTEAGALALGLADAGEVRAAHDRILASARAYDPAARIDGVLVQRMMPPGRELVVGMVRDPDFGPLLMLGFGGVYVDVLRDVAFAPAPVSAADAQRMVDRLRGAAILRGIRGEAGSDVDALVRLLVAVSSIIEDAGPGLRELDLNPVIVYPEGCVAVDTLAVFTPAAEEETG
ncbi:acyl-CoA synthetase [Pseudonocardia saturnea]|uniref:Acyl-CoA synthetase n=1 Tax=Pseudonocardia saturnea TaxID=33909 RepID=A0ABQ0S3J8_9PSEU|nr:acyl-CoA synthetase [Pseudonocardia autotrophica]GEC27358.1 acyl-CoA synthetase [Pseudonocardia saturnea]